MMWVGNSGVLRLVVAGLATAAVGACSSGSGSTSKPDVNVGPLCTTRDPGPSPLRRLTRGDYARTVRDLLGAGLVDTSGLPPDERALGFDNNADVLGSSDLLVEQYQGLAEQAGTAVAASPASFMPCAAGGAAVDAACASSFIADFGRRAWRRPLSADETAMLQGVFTDGNTDGGSAEGLARVTEVILESPQFLYRLESAGDPAASTVADVPGAVPLAPFELASRLSYLVWGSTPDEALLTAAGTGHLTTPADLEREARRLLADPRAHEIVSTFHSEWLSLDKLDDLDKDPVVYAAYSPALRDAFRAETLRFVDEVVFKREGTFSALLGARYTFADATLATYYGVSGPTGATLELVKPDPTRRAGLLTQGSFLAVHAKANQSSPVHRGRFVRESLFCTTPPPPPSNIEIRPPALNPLLSTRQRFAQHESDAFCAGCHTLLDPIGFGFEHYDGIGRWRDQDADAPVDATGALTGTDVDGAFDGAVQLSDRVAGSAEAAQCYATQWFRFGYGRGDTTADACNLSQLGNAFRAAKGDVRELLVALTQTDAFRYRRAEGTTP